MRPVLTFRESFLREMLLPTDPRKFSPSKISRYTVAVSQHEASSPGQSPGFHSVEGEGRGDLTLYISHLKPLALNLLITQNNLKKFKGSDSPKLICHKELGMLNTPTHLSRLHPKFLSLDEILMTCSS